MTTNNPTINVQVTFRHTESTPALKSYATEKLVHLLEKYVHNSAEVHVILSVEKRDQSAEVIIHSKPYELTAKVSKDDLYAAIDGVVDNLLAQLRKQKGKVIDDKHRTPAEL